MTARTRQGLITLVVVTTAVWAGLYHLFGQAPTTPGVMLAGLVGGLAGVMVAER